jgi:hypothetical protein
MLSLTDEHTRECLLIRCERSWMSAKVISALADVMVQKGVPVYLRSDNGPEFVARELLNAGASTTTPSGRIPRWATDRPRQKHGQQKTSRGMK